MKPMTVEWTISSNLIDYRDAEARMLARASDIRAGTEPEWIWLLEHPHIYTVGSSMTLEKTLHAGVPVVSSGRGGQMTYHGPGQRIIYIMLDLQARKLDVRDFVGRIEAWLQAALKNLGVHSWSHPERRGVWCAAPEKAAIAYEQREAKIAAVGLKIKQGVSLHGAAININPDLSYFSAITPCGLEGYGTTSLAALGKNIDLRIFDLLLKSLFEKYFE